MDTAKMNIEQIERNKTYIDYATLNVIREILMNNLNQMGLELFLGIYYSKLNIYLNMWNPAALRYFIALLEYLNPVFSYNGNIRVEKWIVADEALFDRIIGGEYRLLDGLAARTPEAFRKYGILVDMEGRFHNSIGTFCRKVD